jgi:demethylmenaquinone methyltransferase/2-methoxy-6-polyprenyl-1,4-benzoquinol methylase
MAITKAAITFQLLRMFTGLWKRVPDRSHSSRWFFPVLPKARIQTRFESMANKFYQPGEQRSAKVNDLFATIAPRYDLINDLQSFWLHRLWKRKLIRLADIEPGERALDLCCGTGDIAFLLAQKKAEVTGLDFSKAMLAVAEQRCEKAEVECDPLFMHGDAQSVPFPDNQFDVVTVSYGLRNLPNWKRGVEEMWRVAKPGGRLLALDFGKPDNAVWRKLYFTYLKLFVPIFGKLFCGDFDTHGYILESLKNYPAQRGVERQLREMGCEEIQTTNLLGGIMSINYAKKPR